MWNFKKQINKKEFKMLKNANDNTLYVGCMHRQHFFIPNMLQMDSSFIVVDECANYFTEISKTLINHGYKIKIFDEVAFDGEHSHHYNPLHYIQNEDDVRTFVSTLIQHTAYFIKETENIIFQRAEYFLLCACTFYLLHHETGKKNLGGLKDIFSSCLNKNLQPSKLMNKKFEDFPCNSKALEYYESFKKVSEASYFDNALDIVIGLCEQRLSFIDYYITCDGSNLIRNITDYDEMELEKINEEKTAIFIRTPCTFNDLTFFVAILYSQLMDTLIKKDQQISLFEKKPHKIPVRFFIEGFGYNGKIYNLPSKLRELPAHNLSFHIAVHELSEVEEACGYKWMDLIRNCGSAICYGCNLHIICHLFEIYNVDVKNLQNIKSKACIITSKNNHSTFDTFYIDDNQSYRTDERPYSLAIADIFPGH